MPPLLAFRFPHTPTRFTTFPVPPLIAFGFNPVHAFLPVLKYPHIFYIEYRHTPTYKEIAQPNFVYPPPLLVLFVCLLAFFEKSFGRICRPHTRLRIFDFTILIFHPTHYNLTFSLPDTSQIILFVYLASKLFHFHITHVRLKTPFVLPSLHDFLFTSTHYISPFFMDNVRIFAFRHIPETAFCLTHCLLIIMAKTHRTNPHSEEPTPRRSTRTAPRGKSPTARKKPPVSRKKNTSAHKDAANTRDRNTSARKKDAAAPRKGLRTVFSGERKGPPELIPLAPAPPEAEVASRMPTRISAAPQPARPVRNNRTPLPDPPKILHLPEKAFVDPFETNDNYSDVGDETSGDDGNTVISGGKSLDDADYHDCEEDEEDLLHDASEDCDDSRDKDYVPPQSSFNSDDDDFDHLHDDDIDEEDRRITDMQSKSPIRTGRRRGNIILGGPVPPNYSVMSPDEADEARKKFQAERKTWRDSRRRDRLRGNKGSLFDHSEYTGDLTPTLRPMTLVQASRLRVGQTFPESGLVKLRVAEEANHRGIYFSVDKSDESRIVCKGDGAFLVQASNSDVGWRISTCNVLAEHGDQPAPDISAITAIPRSPYNQGFVHHPTHCKNDCDDATCLEQGSPPSARALR
jgi:hypothetical protein